MDGEEPEVTTCDGCAGSGICDACSGYGYFPDTPETDYRGTDCTVCDGTCECTECDGHGSTDSDTDPGVDDEDAAMALLEMRQ
ncbi:hypothetical protein [Pseudonocardia hydrocarbonoxydans]|uniref:hypothetical protein n=1 Tax=Pseudonocardia hydrocarbonoxydans TaxID=76726 RepID=UPI001143A57A